MYQHHHQQKCCPKIHNSN